jgi:hypothetical protein
MRGCHELQTTCDRRQPVYSHNSERFQQRYFADNKPKIMRRAMEKPLQTLQFTD